MSYTIEAKGSFGRPTLGQLLEGLADDRVRCLEELEGPLENGIVFHLYIPGCSTRTVECCLESEGKFSVRLMSSSSPEDHELALRCLEVIGAVGRDVVFEGEDGESGTDLREAFDREWVERSVASGPGVLAQMAKESTVTIPGPHRPSYIGPRLLAELEPEREDFASRLFDAMRRTQYVDVESYYPANSLCADDSPEFAIVSEEVSYLLPAVDYYALLVDQDSAPLFVPADALPKLTDRWCWLDERQRLVEAIEGDDWRALLERARGLEVADFLPRPNPARKRATGPEKRRPWWRFW